jgi:hypothetical protein
MVVNKKRDTSKIQQLKKHYFITTTDRVKLIVG